MKKRILTSCLLGLTLAAGGCASSLTGDTYSRSEARAPQTVRMRAEESVRLVQIEGTKTNIGTGASAVIGGGPGSCVGGGPGSIITGVLGAVAGAAAEEGITRNQGVEITVREDGGQTRAYDQEVDKNVSFAPGERVRILAVNGVSRVSK